MAHMFSKHSRSCVTTPPYYTCISGERGSQQLITLDVTSQAVQLITRPLSEYVNLDTYVGGLQPVDGSSVIPAFIVDYKKIIMIKNNKFELLKMDVADALASVALIDIANGPLVLQAWIDDNQVIWYSPAYLSFRSSELLVCGPHTLLRLITRNRPFNLLVKSKNEFRVLPFAIF